jgi:muramoyltetrapeptide carboxypeptidase LdcA involved in peptidoglycan recycling
MRYPAFLQEKGTIGFAAPSFGCGREPYYTAFQNALAKFERMGYGTQLGPNCLVEKGIGISNTPQLCADELMDIYLSSENDAVISCGGGELMCETISGVDFEAIAQAPPKWYMGYSDNTNFTFLSATLCDTAAIYGPCAASFGMEPWDASIQDAFDLLCGRLDKVYSYGKWERESLKDPEHPLVPYNLTETQQIRYFPQDAEEVLLEGRLIGGCMDCLVTLLGTRFDRVKEFAGRYAADGLIWFLESCDLNPMSIRRAVWQMKEAGWFSHVKGFLIGRPLCFGDELLGADQYNAVTDLLAEYGVPILMDLDIGHLPPMMPLVCGAMAKVQARGNSFTLEYDWR